MRRLTVTKFSCIENATFDLGRVTIIIGPQASGKSVLSKLFYFFFDLFQEELRLIEEGYDLEKFKAHIRERFIEWFPPSAWGPKKFVIEFTARDFQVRIARTTYKGSLGNNLRIWLSATFIEEYTATAERFARLRDIKRSPRTDEFEYIWRLREATQTALAKRLGPDYVQSQLFVPAGRSFFTSIGRAVVALDQGGILDPLTIQFGRRYIAYRERPYRSGPNFGRAVDPIRARLDHILGGKIVRKGEKDFVESSDGRRIPFSSLSSGQQEILPLIVIIPSLLFAARARRLVYIEEPEAHLFPKAQSELLEILAALVQRRPDRTDLLLTTHSPYVLAKINNMIKAGSLFKRFGEKVASRLTPILPKSSWLAPTSVQAYAMIDGQLLSIVDADGLIAADYLDDVSGEIARQFSALLELEISL